jgi:DNA-binding MarR family transcriptional regulator
MKQPAKKPAGKILPLQNQPESPDRLADPRQMRDFLPYRLVQLVSVAGAPVTRWCEGRFGITRRHWRVISILAQEGTLLSSQLAEHLELDRARTSRALGEMEAKHLVLRAALPGNARHVRVSLTAQGRAIFDELRPMLRQHHLSLLAAFSAQQVRDFDAMLATLLQQSITINAAYGSLPKANRRAGLRARAVPEPPAG